MIFYGALFCVLSVFLFLNLGDILLWQDEANMACLAKNTMQFGYPLSFDGVNVIIQNFWDVRSDYVWVIYPWLPFYMIAASFKMFGMETWAARFPFALLGIFFFYLFKKLVQKEYHSIPYQRFLFGILLFQIPLILHFRQCHYYGLTIFGPLLASYAFLQWLDTPNKKYLILFWFSQILIMQSSFLLGFVMIVCFAIAIWMQSNGKVPKRKFLFHLGIIFSVQLFSFLFYQPWLAMARVGPSSLSLQRLTTNMSFYFDMFNEYGVFPWGVSIFMMFLLWQRPKISSLSPLIRLAFIFIIIGPFLFSIGVGQYAYRYIIWCLPFYLIVWIWMLKRIHDRYPKLGKGLLVLFGLVAIFNVRIQKESPYIKSDLLSFIYQITHDFEGPNERLVNFLKDKVHPGDILLTSYPTLPFQFYLPELRVRGGACAIGFETLPHLSRKELLLDKLPRWILPRNQPEIQKLIQGLLNVHGSLYDKITLPGFDRRLENRPSPKFHLFQNPKEGLPIEIYQLKNTL